MKTYGSLHHWIESWVNLHYISNSWVGVIHISLKWGSTDVFSSIHLHGLHNVACDSLGRLSLISSFWSCAFLQTLTSLWFWNSCYIIWGCHRLMFLFTYVIDIYLEEVAVFINPRCVSPSRFCILFCLRTSKSLSMGEWWVSYLHGVIRYLRGILGD